MNKAALRERVRSLSGVRMVTLKSDAEIDDLINEAYQTLCARKDWPFLYVDESLTATAGVPTLTTPATMRVISALTIGSGDDRGRLSQVALSALDEQPDETPDTPVAYARIDATTWRLWPTPDANVELTVRGYREPGELALETDEPIFEGRFHAILAYAAAIDVLAEEADDSPRSQAYAIKIGELLDGMERRYIPGHDVGLFQMGERAPGRRRRWVL